MKVTYEFTDDDECERQMFENAHEFYSALFSIRERTMRIYRGKEEIPDMGDFCEEILNLIGETRLNDIP